MERPSVGNQEMDLLLFIDEHKNPISVRQIMEEFGSSRSLARTTILTMLDRLRKKNYLTRIEVEGVHLYSSLISKNDLLNNLIDDFVKQRLKGSLSPFVAYLAEEAKLTEAELQEFKQLVQDLDNKKGSDKK
jgi:predicted transcriptional regulator